MVEDAVVVIKTVLEFWRDVVAFKRGVEVTFVVFKGGVVEFKRDVGRSDEVLVGSICNQGKDWWVSFSERSGQTSLTFVISITTVNAPPSAPAPATCYTMLLYILMRKVIKKRADCRRDELRAVSWNRSFRNSLCNLVR